MDKTKVVQLLYAEFGDKEFLTRQISEETMAHLVKQIGITETDRPALNSLVGNVLTSLYGGAFRLPTGSPAYVEIKWSDRTHQPLSFQVVPVDVSEGRDIMRKGSDKLVGVEFPDSDMTYTVVLIYSGDGYAVFCPALRGCASQGVDEEDALENIKEAIAGWLKCEVLEVRQRTQALLEEELDAGFPARLVNVNIGQITV